MAKTYYRGGKPYRHVDDSGKSRRVTSDPNIKKKSSSSSSKSPSSTDTFDRSTGRSYVVVQEKDSGDTVGYLVDGKIQKELPKKSSGGSSKNRTITASNKGQTVETVMNDTRTGQTTRTVQDLETGKTISQKTEKTPQRVPAELQIQSMRQRQFVNQGTQIQQDSANVRPMSTISPGGSPFTGRDIVRSQEFKQAGPVKKFFIKDWTKEQYRQRQTFDRSGGEDYNSLLKEFGSGVLADLQDAGVAGRTVYENPYAAVEMARNIDKVPGAIIKEAKTSPAGFIGGVAVSLIGAKATNTVLSPAFSRLKAASTKVDNVRFRSEARTLDTSPNSQGIGVNQVVITGQADITSGFVFKRSRTVDIDASGTLSKESRVSGQKAPDTFVIKDNQVSTEFGPADLISGDLNVKVNGRSRTANVDIVSQGNKQISNIDGQTTFSETYKGPKMNNEQIFITESYNPYTKEGTYTLSKVREPKSSTLPTDDLYASSTISETQSFARRDPMRSSFIDVEGKSINRQQLEYKSSDIKIINIEEPKASQPSFSNPKSQTQVFEDPIQKQKSTSLSASKQGDLSFNKQNFETELKPSNIEIPTSTIRDIYSQRKVPKIKPVPSSSTVQSGGFGYSYDFKQGSFQSPKQSPEMGMGKMPAFDKAQVPVQDSSFKFDSAEKSISRQRQEFESPTYPRTSTQINPSPNIKTGTSFRFSFEMPKSKSLKVKKKQSAASAGEGIYVSSLGGLILNKKAKNPPKTLTGLEIRGIKLR